MPYAFLAIGLGAALGAWARWGLSLWLNPVATHLPLGTLAANLIGGNGVGLAVAWFDSHAAIAPEWKLFAITGLLGGLTTFSTFSAEVTQQLLRQQYGWALATAALHLFGSLAMTALGLASVRAWGGAA